MICGSIGTDFYCISFDIYVYFFRGYYSANFLKRLYLNLTLILHIMYILFLNIQYNNFLPTVIKSFTTMRLCLKNR